MKAMIFAAGLGTRLRPMTENTPKALLQICGKPLLAYAIEKLMAVGVTEIIINVHHLAEQIERYIATNPFPEVDMVISDERHQLLDTGGGLKKGAWFFDDGQPFIVYNTDILTDLDLAEMLRFHQVNEALVTLAVSRRKTVRYLLFDNENRLQGWSNEKTGETTPETVYAAPLQKKAFSGIHIIDPKLFEWMEKTGSFPLIPEYVRLCSHHKIMGFDHTGAQWIDIGKPDSFPQAETFVKNLTKHT